MEEEIKQVSKNVLSSMSQYCRLRVRTDISPCSEGDCEFCPINQAYEMIQGNIAETEGEDKTA